MDILKNSITLWLKWLITSFYYKFKHKKKHIDIKYLASIRDVSFGKYNVVYERTQVDNVKLGDYVYLAPRSIVNNAEIGNFCSIGPDVKIGLGIHPTSFISTSPVFYSRKKQCGVTFSREDILQESERIYIGNDVWIGANVIILDGVKVGDGAIIAAGAVVTKNIEPFCIYGGVPAKKIRPRFSEDYTELIKKTNWWYLEESRLIEITDLILNPKLFYKTFKKEQ